MQTIQVACVVCHSHFFVECMGCGQTSSAMSGFTFVVIRCYATINNSQQLNEFIKNTIINDIHQQIIVLSPDLVVYRLKTLEKKALLMVFEFALKCMLRFLFAIETGV